MAYLHVRAKGEREELIIPCKIKKVDMLDNVIYIIVNKEDEFEDNEEIVLEMINEYEEDTSAFYMDKDKLNGKEQECFIFVLSNDIEENVLKKLFKKESFDSVYLIYTTIPMNDLERELPSHPLNRMILIVQIRNTSYGISQIFVQRCILYQILIYVMRMNFIGNSKKRK